MLLDMTCFFLVSSPNSDVKPNLFLRQTSPVLMLKSQFLKINFPYSSIFHHISIHFWMVTSPFLMANSQLHHVATSAFCAHLRRPRAVGCRGPRGLCASLWRQRGHRFVGLPGQAEGVGSQLRFHLEYGGSMVDIAKIC